MWIRSQDKSSLVNINGVYTNGVEIVCFINGGWINLGTYKSEERALEVLNMIQTRIIKGTTFDYPSLYFKCQRNKGDIW